MKTRRQAFALAATLAATVLTGGAAIAGFAGAGGRPGLATPTVSVQPPLHASAVSAVQRHGDDGGRD